MEETRYVRELELELEILRDLKIDADCDAKELDEKIERKRAILNRCKRNLELLQEDEISYRIYVYILNGLTVTKAIEKVAEENFFNNIKPSSPQAIWRYHYPKLKKLLNV